LEGAICRLGYRVGLQHDLSSANKWSDIEGQHDLGRYVEYVCDALTEEMGIVSTIG